MSQSEIRVYPGTIIDGDGNKVIFTLTPIIGETREAYEHRCHEVFKLAVSFVTPSQPTTFQVGDTSRYRKVSENAYEIITPGYQSTEAQAQEMRDVGSKPPVDKAVDFIFGEGPGNERDTHFAGFARLQYEDLYDMFSNLFIEEADMEPRKQEAEHTRQNIQAYLAESAYDLVFHLLKNSKPLYLDMSGYMSDPPDEDVHQNIAKLPDMTEWPEPE